MRDLLCVGNAVADTKARPVSAIPARGKLGFVSTIGLHGGGCALNTGLAAARLGLRTGIGTAVGRDSFGDFLVRLLETEGVNTTGLLRDRKTQTSATVVLISPDGERSFLHTVGASAAITDGIAPDRLLKGYRALHLSGFFLLPRLDGAPARRLLARARKLGLTTSLDTCWDPGRRWRLVISCLPHVDYYMPSYEEAREVFGEAAPGRIASAALRAGVRRAVILKMGTKGCYALARGGAPVSVPAFRVRAVDSTGAGDAFDAGFLAGILRGWRIERAILLGCAAGALSVAGFGGWGKIESFRRTLRFMRRGRPA